MRKYSKSIKQMREEEEGEGEKHKCKRLKARKEKD